MLRAPLALLLALGALSLPLASGGGLSALNIQRGNGHAVSAAQSSSTTDARKRIPIVDSGKVQRMSLRGGERDLGGGVEVRELGAKSVRLHYRSGWNRVYLHLSRDEGKTWTIKPDQVSFLTTVCGSFSMY
eukprot:3935358-Rhodomonas_salina.1